MPVLNAVSDAIGNTPLIRLSGCGAEAVDCEILLKMESENPLKSVKDRLAKALVEDGEARGVLTKGTRMIEPTSGNTGIALACLAAERGYKLTLAMPSAVSLERQALVQHYGAELVLTPDVKAAFAVAQERYDAEIAAGRRAWMPSQFTNPANPAMHEKTTGPEIWEDADGDVDAIVAGAGTGGTITGVTRFLRSKNPDVKAFAVEPADSPVISGGQPGKHKIQGIGVGFIPATLDTSLLNGVETVASEDAFAMSRRLAKESGILVGISAGAAVVAALRVAARPDFKGKRICVIMPSFGERYISTELFLKDEEA